MTVSLGMPETPPRPLATRRVSRQIDVGGVLVGGDAPVSVQSMTTTPDRRHQRHAAADRRADRLRLPDRPGRGAEPGRRRGAAGDREEVADPGHRRHPLPAEVRLRRHRRRLRRGAGQPGQHQGVRRQGRSEIAKAAGDAGVPIRIGVNAGSLDKRLMAKYGKATPGGAGRVGAVGVLAVRGARLPRHQDLGQAQRPGRHGQRLPTARRAVRLPAAPRRHRGRAGLPGHHQVRGGLRRAAGRGHRRHDPGLAVRAAGRGGQGRQPDPRVARPAAARPGDRLLPVLRPGPGRRLHAGRPGHRRPRGPDRPAAGGRHGLRRQRPGRGPRGRPRRRVGQRQGADLRQGRGDQDRARVADRRDADRGGHAHRRADGGRRA